MADIIKDIAFHKARREKAQEKRERWWREQTDPMDNALSAWANSSTDSFDRLAIQCLEAGAAAGIDGPADEHWVLWDLAGNRRVPARTVSSVHHGNRSWAWMLTDPADIERFGRKFIPKSRKPGRIQKSLGLEERRILVPVERTVRSTCAFVGAPVNFITVEKGAEG